MNLYDLTSGLLDRDPVSGVTINALQIFAMFPWRVFG